MIGTEEYKTLLLRNEVSIKLDDLTSLIKSSSLSYEVRQFSNEVMETEPGFVFKLRQAQDLKRRTDEVYKNYKTQTHSDVEVMDYLEMGRRILKGEDIPGDRRDIMSILGKVKDLLNSKDIKRQQAIDELKRTYQAVCEQIVQCEDGMKRAIQNGTGHSKDSMVYRDSAREYSRCKNKLTLLRQQQEQLNGKLQKLDDIENVRRFTEMQDSINKASQHAIGNDTENERILAKAGLYMEKAKQDAQYDSSFGRSLYEQAEANAVPQTDSEFDAAVAQNERRVSIMNATGIDQEQQQLDDEFAALTGNADKAEN